MCPSTDFLTIINFQQYMTMFGSTVAIPFILAGPLCVSNNNLVLSEIISTIFCVSGIATLLQSSIGNRFVSIKLHDSSGLDTELYSSRLVSLL